MNARNIAKKPTVGILFPGEMGCALGRVLVEEGLRVVTTLEGRGSRTARLCHDSLLEVLPSVAEVARCADLVFSVVTPAAALSVARTYAVCCKRAEAPRIYVDVNSIAPATAVAVGHVVSAGGARFVDGAIHGLASQLASRGVVYLSGPDVVAPAALLGRSLRVRIVGDRPGQASAVKGALAGMSKGLAALFTEIALLARRAGVREHFQEGCGLFYPGVVEAVERLLPTYPRHAGRRAEELAELETSMETLGMRPAMVPAARDVITAIAAAGLENESPRRWTAAEVIEALHGAGCRGRKRLASKLQ
jgi:3-hydroxyisobutyrate dehydrogenase-like beta-hydroxyacid dehydrogenase